MNVTIMVAKSLQAACDGRQRIELGVPNSTGIGDIIQTLLSLYPKLVRHMAHERADSTKSHFGVVPFGKMLFLVANSGKALEQA